MKKPPSADRRGPKSQFIPSTTKFGKEVQRLRVEKGWTTPELAERVGVTDASITQTETGQTLPRKPTVKVYENVLGGSLMQFWERDMKKRRSERQRRDYVRVEEESKLTEDKHKERDATPLATRRKKK